MCERVELGHGRVDLCKQIASLRGRLQQLRHDRPVALAKVGGGGSEWLFIAGGGSSSALEKGIGDTGKGGDDDDGARRLSAGDLDCCRERMGVGERCAAEFMDSYSRHLRRERGTAGHSRLRAFGAPLGMTANDQPSNCVQRAAHS